MVFTPTPAYITMALLDTGPRSMNDSDQSDGLETLNNQTTEKVLYR